MPIITNRDLETNLYAEVITEITREDATITDRAIAAATSEAKMYLGKYDLEALFGNEHTLPVVEDEYLKTLVKDLACWHLLRLSNTGVDYTVFRNAYTDAIAALKTIMSGQAQPSGWPYATSVATEIPESGVISWSSNPKRSNYY